MTIEKFHPLLQNKQINKNNKIEILSKKSLNIDNITILYKVINLLTYIVILKNY